MSVLLEPDNFTTQSGKLMQAAGSSGMHFDGEATPMAEKTERVSATFPVRDGLSGNRPATDGREILHFTDRRIPLEQVATEPCIHDAQWLTERWTREYQLVKRAFDVGFSLLMLVACSPMILAMALLISLDSGGPIIYTQYRIGRGGELFRIYKFRTMRRDAEADGPLFSSRNDPRITRVGGFMRRTRIDELPQFCNVIQGSMSIIGPRPERPEYEQALEAEIPGFALRTAVKPGLTGWAQVCAPYASTVQESRQKLEYDLYYIRNASIGMDLQIAWRTIMVVLKGGGV